MTNKYSFATLLRSILLFYAILYPCLQIQAEENKSDMSKNPIIVLETTQGNIEIRLMPDVAPKATENFVKLAESKYYDGLTFHRVIKDFMIQGGDPKGNGTGGQSVWGKPFADEFNVDVTFSKPGLLAMANSGPNSNGSQFFITTVPTPWLNNRHTIFGEVIKGQDVVAKIENVQKGPGDRPLEPQKIIKAYVKNPEGAAQ
jgi:peptidylprolyl isomerase